MRGSDMTTEQLIGYDVRVLWRGETPDWPMSRRKTYLFRQNAPIPLSTDEMVWPSAFDCRSDCPGRLERRFLQFIWHNDLWADLPILSAYRDRYFVSSADGAFSPITVAFTLALCSASERFELCKLRGVVRPAVLDGTWFCLGYDVSDRWLLSALSNCGHVSEFENGDLLRDRWAPCLNEHHLFRTLSDADAFRLLANDDVPEHKPFYVYGIWTTRGENGGMENA